MTTGSLPCPGCGAPLATAPGTARCPACRLPLLGQDAAALWQVTVALNALDAQRQGLIVRRDQLLGALRARQDLPDPPAPLPWSQQLSAGPGGPVGPNWAAPAAPWGRPPVPAAGKEVSGPSAQTVLLVLGGLMVAIAALVFTVVSWGSLGIGGRAAVLAGVTLCALLAPLPLRRRGLTATAETSAVLGLALVLLDWLAARTVGLAGLDRVPAASYWAAATALTALGAASYGTVLKLRGPRATALALAQLPLSLAALAIDTDIGGYATAFLLTALLDLLLATRTSRRAPRVRTDAVTATPVTAPAPTAGRLAHALVACGVGFTLLGALTSATQLLTATSLTEARLAWPALALLSALGVAVSTGRPAALLPRTVGHELRCAAAVLAGAAPLAAIGASLRFSLPASWVPAGYAVPGALLLLAALQVLTSATPETAPSEAAASEAGTPEAATSEAGRSSRTPDADGGALGGSPAQGATPHPAATDATGPATPPAPPTSLGLFIAGAAAVLLAQLAVLPALARAFFGPVERWALAWDWPGTDATELHTTAWSLPLAPAALFALLTALLATTALRCARTGRTAPAHVLLRTALATGSTLACLLPTLFELPLTTGAFWALALTAAATAALALQHPTDPTSHLLVLLPSATAAVIWGGTDRTATLVVWSALTAGAALLASRLPHRWAAPFGGFAVASLAVTALAAGQTGGLAAYELAFLLLAVTALTVAAAAGIAHRGDRSSLALAVEGTGYALALPAFALTAGHPGALSLALAVGGVLALAVALRPDRRRAALVGTGLLVLSSWVRLALAGVTVPEPYTLSVAAAALTIGHLRRRRSPELSSTAAYGAGLGLALLPSLVAVWAEPTWPRPLLLGTAALALTVLGARQRLRAPLLFGAVTLTAVAVHELTPLVTQLIGALPRWVPLAAAGLLLLVLGATYERRLRDARRVRDGLRRLH